LGRIAQKRTAIKQPSSPLGMKKAARREVGGLRRDAGLPGDATRGCGSID
jgi:hypothetical protein